MKSTWSSFVTLLSRHAQSDRRTSYRDTGVVHRVTNRFSDFLFYLCFIYLLIRGLGFDPRRYQIFWVAMGLERGPLSLVKSNWGAIWIKKSSGSRFRKQRLTDVGTRCANHVTPLYPQKLALTSPTGGGRSVGMVRSRTKATEFS